MMLLDSEDEDVKSVDGEDQHTSASRSRSRSESGFRDSGETLDGLGYEDSEGEESHDDRSHDRSCGKEKVHELKGKELEKIMSTKTENRQTLYLMKFKGTLCYLCYAHAWLHGTSTSNLQQHFMFHATLRCNFLRSSAIPEVVLGSRAAHFGVFTPACHGLALISTNSPDKPEIVDMKSRNVQQRTAGVSYRHLEWRTHAFVHAKRPALVTGFNRKLAKGTAPANASGTTDGVCPEWRVAERVFASREVSGARQYLVKWSMLGYAESTWEDSSQLTSGEVRSHASPCLPLLHCLPCVRWSSAYALGLKSRMSSTLTQAGA
jgi:hypothetical protein